MSAQPNRLVTGGRIDRSQTLLLDFNGRELLAHPGDTLASAMLAGGMKTVARSFKYHRARGVMTAGPEEPNALVTLRRGNRREPNTPATMIEAYDGLEAVAQNAWPNVAFDVGAINQLAGPLLSAGFYYKTFMGPVVGPMKGTRFWMFCEHFIRRAAGMGVAGRQADPDAYEKVNAFCDVLVIGAGPAGLAAARAAADQGGKVILVEQDHELGGTLLSEPVDGPTENWRVAAIAALQDRDNITILRRTTAFGAYDGNVYGLLERCWDHVATPPHGQPRQRYWQVRAGRTVLATGALERPMIFAGNDRPGVMTASALATYVNRFGVLPSRDVVIATNNDSAYRSALAACTAGARVTLVDARSEAPGPLMDAVIAAGGRVRLRSGVLKARGERADAWRAVAAVEIGVLDAQGRLQGVSETLACETLAFSGGWSPVLHLWSHPGRKPVYDERLDCFVAGSTTFDGGILAGAAAARSTLKDVIADGRQAGLAGAGENFLPESADSSLPRMRDADAVDWGRDIARVRFVTDRDGNVAGKAFVDFQHDVTLSDIDQAHREGYVSVEHLKRYTTTGMSTDQGKTSNVNALARMAQLRGIVLGDVGTTTFRPPYTPVSIGALAGHAHGAHLAPTRETPMHDWHVAHGAVLIDAGAWKRPQYYPEPGESIEAAYRREAKHVREHVGMVDVSTLGKIAVQGPDAAEFLNRVYVNGWKTLAIGRIRYGIMLREDGFVLDDGATARVGEHDYLMSTTTTNAGPVLAHLEYLLQTAWPELKVHVTSVTDQWAAIAVAGPQARALLSAAVQGADLSAAALPNNHWINARVGHVAVRVHRMSYSGELAYEVYVPSGHGSFVWSQLYETGQSFNVIAYGTEAMGTLRIEKGHVAGPELDGRTTLADLALEGFASTRKPFVGGLLRKRDALADPRRPSLVGLAIEGDRGARAGMLLFPATGATEGFGDGHVTSTTYSPALGRYIAMGLLAGGQSRLGETVRCVDFVGDLTVQAKVVSHHFFDPEGSRQNG